MSDGIISSTGPRAASIVATTEGVHDKLAVRRAPRLGAGPRGDYAADTTSAPGSASRTSSMLAVRTAGALAPATAEIAAALAFAANEPAARTPSTRDVSELRDAGLCEVLSASEYSDLTASRVVLAAGTKALAGHRAAAAEAKSKLDGCIDAVANYFSPARQAEAEQALAQANAQIQRLEHALGKNPGSDLEALEKTIASWVPVADGAIRLTARGRDVRAWIAAGGGVEDLHSIAAALEGVSERVGALSKTHTEIFDGVQNCGDVESAVYAASGCDKGIGAIHGPVYRDTSNCGSEATTALVLQNKRGERSIETARTEYARVYRDTQQCGDVASTILVGIGQEIDPAKVRSTYARIYTETQRCGDVASAILAKLVLVHGIGEGEVRALYRRIYDSTPHCGDIASAMLVREVVLHRTPIETLQAMFAKAHPLCRNDVATALCVLTALRTQAPLEAVVLTARRVYADVQNCGHVAAAVISAAAHQNPEAPALLDAALGAAAEQERRKRRSSDSGFNYGFGTGYGMGSQGWGYYVGGVKL